MFVLTQLYLLIVKLFLAGKDASSYLLKDKTDNALTKKRINRWHRDGVALDVLSTLPLAYINTRDWAFVILTSVLLRLSVFDLAFNKWASLNIHHLGSTAWFDQQFAKIFGVNGAVQKSVFFMIVLIVFNVLKLIFKF